MNKKCQPLLTISSINIALESAEQTYGTVEGLRIDCLYNKLEEQLNINPLRSKLANHVPFTSAGNIPQRGYIHRLSPFAAKIMLDEIKKLGNCVQTEPEVKAENTVKVKKYSTLKAKKQKTPITLEE